MRTTLNIDDHVMMLAKKTAALRHCSLGKFVEDALRQVLAATACGTKRRKSVDLPESGDGGLQPGVDMDSTADLLCVMEGKDDSYGR